MRNLPRPGSASHPIFAPHKYMAVLDLLREHGPCSVRYVGIKVLGLRDGAPTSRSTSMAYGRLRSLEAVGAVERLPAPEAGGKVETDGPILWRITEAGRCARR